MFWLCILSTNSHQASAEWSYRSWKEIFQLNRNAERNNAQYEILWATTCYDRVKTPTVHAIFKRTFNAKKSGNKFIESTAEKKCTIHHFINGKL